MGVVKPFLLFTLLLLAASCARDSVRNRVQPEKIEPWRISPANAKASEPAVATGVDGEVYLTYVEHGTEGSNVFLQPLDSLGKAKGERVRVNDELNTAKTWGGDPPTLAVGKDGTIHVGWTKKYPDPKARGTQLMLSVSRDGGRSFEPAVKVNDDSELASHGMHSIAVGQDGRIIMAWLDERNVGKDPHKSTPMPAAHHEEVEPNSEVFTAVSIDGGKTFSPNKKIAGEVCPCCKTSLLIDEGGTVYASWRQVLEGDHRHMAVASSTDGGVTFSPGVVVSNDQWQLSACPVSGAALTSTGPDQLEVTWYTAGSAGVAGLYSARSTDRGRSFSERRLVSGTAAAGTPVVNPTYVLFNSQNGSLTARPFKPDTPIPVEIPEAAAPTAAILKDHTVVAFVRTNNGSASVWASVLPN